MSAVPLRAFDYARAAILWSEDKNTREIANALGCDEADVWNKLDLIKREARGQ